MTHLAAALALALLAQAPDYSGKYARDPRFESKFGRIEDQRKTALETVAAKLHLAPADPSRIQVELRDALPAGSDPLRPFSGGQFMTMSLGMNQLIVIHTEFIINGQFDLQTELNHEATHAVMRERMKGEHYDALPHWFREGIAVWTAGQIPLRVSLLFSAFKTMKDPEAALPGLEEGEFNTNRYAESGLAIESIARRGGSDGIPALIKKVVAGAELHEAIREITSLDWKDFRKRARQEALEKLRAARPRETDAYLRIVDLGEDGDDDGVRTASDAFLAASPKSPFKGHVLYWRGKACRLLKKRIEALGSLQELIDEHAMDSSLADDGMTQLGLTLMEMDLFEEAARLFESMLADHPDCGALDGALYNLAVCRARLARPADALKLLDLLKRSFPGSPVLGRADELRKSLTSR